MANAWTRVGTSYFISERRAIDYQQATNGSAFIEATFTVRQKLRDGEIHIGKPSLKPGQRLLVIDNGTRYAIETPDGIK